MKLREKSNRRNTQHIETIRTHPTHRNVPKFVQPTTPRGQQQTKPYKTLLDRRAGIDNLRGERGRKSKGIGRHTHARITKQSNNPIRLVGNTTRHPRKWNRDVPPKQGDGSTLCVKTLNRELPQHIGREQGQNENKYVGISTQREFVNLSIYQFVNL